MAECWFMQIHAENKSINTASDQKNDNINHSSVTIWNSSPMISAIRGVAIKW